MTAATSDGAPGARSGSRRVPISLVILGAIIVARLLVAAWWLSVDEGIFDSESGRHAQRTWDGYLAMGTRPFALFESATDYPPLLYLVGSLGALVGGLHPDSFVAAQAVLLVPALALGCYGAASVAYGPTAGVLAAVFALAAPMAVSVFHMYLIDTIEMVMVALSIWGVLASRRFSRTGVSALAGVAVGLGMLSKQNFPLFLAGLLAVVVLRGGWRHWRGLLVFAGVVVVISSSWYWSEVERTLGLVQGASGTPSGSEASGGEQPERGSLRNVAWYAWSTLNVSTLLPLTLAFVGGAVALSVRWLRTRATDDPTPELVGGALVAYAGLTWIALKDPRYALPLLPYMAILGTGWLELVRGRYRLAGIAVLAFVAVGNVAGAVTGAGGLVRFQVLPNASESAIGKRYVTLYNPGGWITGRPETSGAIVDVMRAAAADPTVDAIVFDPGARQSNFNHPGLDIAARQAGIPIAIPHDPQDPRQVVIANRLPPLPDRPPCATQRDGTGIYLSRGSIDLLFEQRDFYCPPGAPTPGTPR